jgi:hypothetical protein
MKLKYFQLPNNKLIETLTILGGTMRVQSMYRISHKDWNSMGHFDINIVERPGGDNLLISYCRVDTIYQANEPGGDLISYIKNKNQITLMLLSIFAEMWCTFILLIGIGLSHDFFLQVEPKNNMKFLYTYNPSLYYIVHCAQNVLSISPYTLHAKLENTFCAQCS